MQVINQVVKKAKTYLIQFKTGKNVKVRGQLVESVDSQLGKVYLVGQQLYKEVRTRQGTEQVWMDFRLDITNATYTTKG